MTDLARRLEAWQEFDRWQRLNPEPLPGFSELIVWLARALTIARQAGDLAEPSPHKVAIRVAERKAALSWILPAS